VEHGSAIPCVPLKDSVRQITSLGSTALDRTKLRAIQTPQCFHSKLLLPAMLKIEFKEKFTDEATVVESFGIDLHLMEGEDTNLKITTPIDMMMAEQILLQRIKQGVEV